MKGALLGLALALLFSGCVESAPVAPLDAANAAIGRPIVVAMVDTGVNPYAEVFQRDLAPLVGAAAIPLDLTRAGPYEERVRADSGIWQGVAPRTLYRFNGTRLYGISFHPERPTDGIRDTNGHGTGVAEAIAQTSPDVVIVIIQAGESDDCAYVTECMAHPSYAEGIAWAAAQPWIDILSLSIGPFGSPPDHPNLHPEMQTWLDATRQAVRSGKIVVNSAGNAPVIVQTYSSGPPWVVAVGSVREEQRGDEPETPRSVDVVANVSFQATRAESIDEKEWWTGTSFAAPVVSGTLAEALHIIRQAEPGRVVSPRELRDALNASAIYFSASEWKPVPVQGREGPVIDTVTGVTIPIVAQPQMGWGYVNGSLAPEIARRVLAQDFSISSEKDQAMLFQPAWQKAREEYWAQYRR